MQTKPVELPDCLYTFQKQDSLMKYDEKYYRRFENVSKIFNQYQTILANIINYLVLYQNTALDGMKMEIAIRKQYTDLIVENNQFDNVSGTINDNLINVLIHDNRLLSSFLDIAFLAKTTHLRNMFFTPTIGASGHTPTTAMWNTTDDSGWWLPEHRALYKQEVIQLIPLPKRLPHPSTIILANACQLWICPRMNRGHFTLVVINWATHVIYMYDSGMTNRRYDFKQYPILQQWIREDCKYHLYCLSFFRSYSEIMAKEWTVRPIYDMKLYQQSDRHSCGYFVIAFYNGLVDWLTQVLFKNRSMENGVDFMKKYTNFDVTESARRLGTVFKMYGCFMLPTNMHDRNFLFNNTTFVCYQSFFSDTNTPKIKPVKYEIDCSTFMKECAEQIRSEIGIIDNTPI